MRRPAQTVCAVQASTVDDACPRLEPGIGLGRFRLGTRLSGSTAVVPDAVAGWTRPADPGGHATRLRFDGDVLATIETPMPGCVRLGTADHMVRTTEPMQLAAAIGTCGPLEIDEGGNTLRCAGVLLTMGSDRSPPALRFQASLPAPPTACTDYAEPGRRIDGQGVTASESIDLTPAMRLCVAGFPTAFSQQTRPSDLPGGCRTQENRGGTVATCGDMTLTFAGPSTYLSRVSIAPR